MEINNHTGFIGAKIEADKAISVTNGVFNGQLFSQASDESFVTGQIMLDQAVPEERLGEKFVALRAFGTSLKGEKVFVMAVENGTQIYLNDESTPFITLNAGEYAVIPSDQYVFQRIGMYSMYISASQKIYTYQISTNSDKPDDGSYRKGSFMMVPPLNCYLPSIIDQIGYAPSGNTRTKLNILTTKGSEVKVNGTLLGSDYGPENVKGTDQWVNFGFFANGDHLTIESSNGPVTVGMFSEPQFGGYFAGFSSVPAIAKTGDCVNGVFLNVDNSYENYTWYKDGVLIPNENSFQINPELYGTGEYECEVSKGSCEPLRTNSFYYERCLDGIVSEEKIGSCQTLEIHPSFENGEEIDFSKFAFLTLPLKGSVERNGETLTYFPDPNATESYTDDFTYRIYSTDADPKIQTFSVKIKVHVLNLPTPAELIICTDQPENATFNLNNFEYGKEEGNTVEFYSDEELTKPIINIESYKDTELVFAKVTSAFGCVQTVTINLILLDGIPSEDVSYPICFDKNQTEETVSLRQYVDSSEGNEVSFHTTPEDAESNINPIEEHQSIQENVTFYARIKKGQCVQINSITFTIYKQPEVQIETQGSIVKITTTGGTPPFLFALDDQPATSETNFYTVTSGFHTISITTAIGCEPQIYSVFVNTLNNVITPNGDHLNDVFSYAEFTEKEYFKIQIFGRESLIIHQNDNNPSITFWDGKYNRKAPPTGTYWYVLEWQEAGVKHSITGWILLKNRD